MSKAFFNCLGAVFILLTVIIAVFSDSPILNLLIFLYLAGFVIYIINKNSKSAIQKREQKKALQQEKETWANWLRNAPEEMSVRRKDLAEFDEDYLTLFIERVRDNYLFSLTSAFPSLSDLIVSEDIKAINDFKYLTSCDNPSILKDRLVHYLAVAEEQSVINLTPDQINILTADKLQYENALVVLRDLPELQALLRAKGVDLKYWQLIWLLQEKLKTRQDETMSEATEELRSSLETMIPIILVEHNLNKDNEGVATALAIARQLLFSSTPNAVAGHIVLENMLPILFRKYSAYSDSLSELQIGELLSKAQQSWKIALFEKDLKAAKKVEIFKLSDMVNASGEDFEIQLEKLFRHLGYSVVRTPLTGDQGADLVIEKDNVRTAVQAKRYSSSVPNTAIQEVVAASKHYKCQKCLVVTTSKYARSAKELAISNSVELWGLKELKEAVEKANGQKNNN